MDRTSQPARRPPARRSRVLLVFLLALTSLAGSGCVAMVTVWYPSVEKGRVPEIVDRDDGHWRWPRSLEWEARSHGVSLEPSSDGRAHEEKWVERGRLLWAGASLWVVLPLPIGIPVGFSKRTTRVRHDGIVEYSNELQRERTWGALWMPGRCGGWVVKDGEPR